ncbi:MAG: hypothetical protein HYX72_14000 [Acidobacteria bacterium]|nr:hypothetical protein [Acidobacteriota bacterium]
MMRKKQIDEYRSLLNLNKISYKEFQDAETAIALNAERERMDAVKTYPGARRFTGAGV